MSGNGEHNVGEDFRRALSVHGYGFHFAVLKEIENLHKHDRVRWRFWASEFPVVADRNTHIDFVLHLGGTYLVAECKRVDPARARWCFARAPYTWPDLHGRKEIVFDQLEYDPPPELIHSVPRCLDFESYHLGLELKTKRKGDGCGPATGAIDAAVTQVLRGTSGLLNHLFGPAFPDEPIPTVARVLPTIFTTAELWTTDADLSESDLETGNLEPGSVDAERQNWLWFTHHRSPTLEHEVRADERARYFRHRVARTVAIVGPSGIEDFLKVDWDVYLRESPVLVSEPHG